MILHHLRRLRADRKIRRRPKLASPMPVPPGGLVPAVPFGQHQAGVPALLGVALGEAAGGVRDDRGEDVADGARQRRADELLPALELAAPRPVHDVAVPRPQVAHGPVGVAAAAASAHSAQTLQPHGPISLASSAAAAAARDPLLWALAAAARFAHPPRALAGARETYKALDAMRFAASFAARNIEHNMETVTFSRGVRYNNYFKNSWHFTAPAAPAASAPASPRAISAAPTPPAPRTRSLTFRFRIPLVPSRGLLLSVTHLAFKDPTLNPNRFSAFVTIAVNDVPVAEKVSPQSHEYVTDVFAVPRDALVEGENVVAWSYEPDATQYYWIQRFEIAVPQAKPPPAAVVEGAQQAPGAAERVADPEKASAYASAAAAAAQRGAGKGAQNGVELCT
eukprot:CAMPEP_0174885162 /NCGR_PEP_ID=MMETSP0167-20121228/519_1 /TAXON_ID=38298 /ORGANISM="Rhodella maculata, Strain CCMP736" /LENGTH=394 /DNA_ID=CAMNT_0016120677 /DNA_START=489 /DNA_END=1674 /DNA_ORIENTATION=+